jgi:hypothetical protein
MYYLQQDSNQNSKNFYFEFFQQNKIRGNGYPVEAYSVTTEDCYILKLHRIPYGKNSPKIKVHSFTDSKSVFLNRCAAEQF